MPLQVTHGPILSMTESGRRLQIFVRLTDSNAGQDHLAPSLTFFIHLRQQGQETTHGPFLTRSDKRQTCIASFPVDPGVAAEYWLAEADGRQLTRRFRCLPPSIDQGDLVIYQVSDAHGFNDVWPANLLQHYRDKHAGVPAVVLYVGDLWNVLFAETDSETALQDHHLSCWAVPAVKKLLSQIPLLQMWDDWDYLGDNSSRTHTSSRGLKDIDRTMALSVRRDFMPGPRRVIASGSDGDAGYAVTLAGNLLLVPDSRSMKEPAATSAEGVCFDALDGSQRALCWGKDQLDWMKQVLAAATGCYKIFFVSTQTFVDNLQVPILPCEGDTTGVRDSLGLFHKWERNRLLRKVVDLGLLQTERRFVVLSGDDHTPLVRSRSHWHAPYRLKTEEPVSEPELDGVTLWEFKSGNGGSTTRVFDSAEAPPIWWGGCSDDYAANPPAWGTANSRRADVAFCWRVRNVGEEQSCTVEAVLLEDEPAAPCPNQLPRTAPRVLLEKDFS